MSSKNPLDDIPEIGLGTWQNKDPEQCATSVRNALELGYRHIDTAQIYKNEEYVGKGLEQSSVDREDIFLATKVWIENLSPDRVEESTEESLQKLGVDHVDLMYIHWPAGDYDPRRTLPAMENLIENEYTEYIGLSNFTPSQLDEALDVLNKDVLAHQVEMHPHLQQQELHEYCLERDINIVAYSPFRHGTIFDDPVLNEIADAHNATPAQICLAWLTSHERVVTIPKATGEQHIRENFEAKDIELTEDEVQKIGELKKKDRYIDPPFGPW